MGEFLPPLWKRLESFTELTVRLLLLESSYAVDVFLMAFLFSKKEGVVMLTRSNCSCFELNRLALSARLLALEILAARAIGVISTLLSLIWGSIPSYSRLWYILLKRDGFVGIEVRLSSRYMSIRLVLDDCFYIDLFGTKDRGLVSILFFLASILFIRVLSISCCCSPGNIVL